MKTVLARLSGVFLLLVALGPLVVVIACYAAAIIEVLGTAKLVIARAEPVVQAVQTQIVPVARRIEAQAAELGTALTTARSQVDRTLNTLADVGTLRIGKGQLGQTPTLHVRLPAEDRTFGALGGRTTVLLAMHRPAGHAIDAGPDDVVRMAGLFDPITPKLPDALKLPDLPKIPELKIGAGSILDKELPSVPMPPKPVAAELPALRQVFAPLGPDGTMGKAVQAAAREVGTTLGEVGKLKDSLMGIVDRLLDVAQLLPKTIPLMLATFVAIQLAVVTLLLMCLAATAYVVLRRPGEAAAAFMLMPLGFIFYCLRTVLIEAASRCFARPTPQTPAEAVADLRGQVVTLKARVAARRAAATTIAGA